MDATVSLRGVSRWFGEEPVLKDVDLDVPPGSVSALLGRNGSGKSTLIRIIAGSLARHGGQARVLGDDPELLSPRDRQRLVWITDQTAANPMRRIEDELELRAGLRAGKFDLERAKELLARWEVDPSKRINELSRGLQARFRLASALAARPELLLLDEPTLGLDLFARRDLLEVIVDVVSELEAAVVIASHQLEDVERIADQITFLHEGGVPAQGTPDELRDRFRRVRVEASDQASLEDACGRLLGVRRVERDDDDPQGQFVVHFEDYSQSLEDEMVAASGATIVDRFRPKLADVYLEVLAPQPTQGVA